MEGKSLSIVRWHSRRYKYIQWTFYQGGLIVAAFNGQLEKQEYLPGKHCLVKLEAIIPGKYAIYDDTEWAAEVLETYTDWSGAREYIRSNDAI